jgi:hypothetical protein
VTGRNFSILQAFYEVSPDLPQVISAPYVNYPYRYCLRDSTSFTLGRMAPTQQAHSWNLERGNPERRVKTRYNLALEVSYCVLGGARSGEAGTGRTVDVSSAALRFAAERPLANGLGMEIVVDWPTLLDGRVPLKLIATGLVIRTHGTETVVKIERYVFKTRKTR